MSSVRLSGISKRFGDTIVIDHLSLSIDEGEFIVLLGPSGCGKSTILRMIAGLEAVDEGEIMLGETRVDGLPPGKRGAAMVFQSYALYPHMTVRENLAFGLRNVGVAPGEIERRTASAAAILEIDHLLARKPGQLSGGQRQRVAIARAIVKEPRLFLFDEPLSNLDAALRSRTRIELAQLHRRLGATMIFVTHDQVEAMTLADRIVVLNEGKVEQVGTPTDIYRRPATRFVATFVGSPRMNLLPAAVSPGAGGAAEIELPGGVRLASAIALASLPEGADLTAGLRPEHVRVSTPGRDPDVCAEVQVVERLGDRTLLHVELPGGEPLVAEDAGLSTVRAGEAVGLSIDSAAVHLFDAAGRGYHPAPAP